MKKCKECYSINNRITPLLHPDDCLREHEQYICGTCGRCICIQHDPKRNLQRWNFPFRSLDIALLYLRSAEYTTKSCCAIYEILKNNRISYKIFKNQEDVISYKKMHPDVQVTLNYQNDKYLEYPNSQVRRLSETEIRLYLQEQSSQKLTR